MPGRPQLTSSGDFEQALTDLHTPREKRFVVFPNCTGPALINLNPAWTIGTNDVGKLVRREREPLRGTGHLLGFAFCFVAEAA
jgi:hypothetical protein